MAVVTGTGLGGVVTTFNVGSFTVGSWEYVSITGYEETVAILDDTHLGSTTFEESIPVSLAALPEQTITMHWLYDQLVPGAGASSYEPGDAFTVTISMPTRTGFGTTGSITGEATITSVKLPDHTTGDRSMGTMTIKWTGKTGPTYTPSSV